MISVHGLNYSSDRKEIRMPRNEDLKLKHLKYN